MAVVPREIDVGRGIRLTTVEAGEGSPVVFVHGGGSDWRYWEPHLDRFAAHFRCLAYSRRYAWPNRNAPIVPDYSARVDSHDLEALLERWAGEAVHIVAASIGAAASLFLTVRRPELVRSLVVAEPPVLRWLLDVPGGKVAFDDFMARGWNAAATAFREGERERGVGAFIDYFIGSGRFAKFPPHMRARIMEDSRDFEALTTSTDPFPPLPREAVEALPHPVLLLSGARTPRMHAMLDTEMERMLRHAQRRIFPEAGHDLWIEAFEDAQDSTLAFLLAQDVR